MILLFLSSLVLFPSISNNHMQMLTPRKSKRSVRKYLAVTRKNLSLLLRRTSAIQELSCLFCQSSPTGQLGILDSILEGAAVPFQKERTFNIYIHFFLKLDHIVLQ